MLLFKGSNQTLTTAPFCDQASYTVLLRKIMPNIYRPEYIQLNSLRVKRITWLLHPTTSTVAYVLN